MNRLDRALGIVLALRGGKEVTAQQLAQRFEVSPRTIYRDIETLSTLGIPIFAERGRAGGFRLLEGYFLPPIMFTQEEALGKRIAGQNSHDAEAGGAAAPGLVLSPGSV